MNITKATYGNKDCLSVIKGKIKKDQLILRVDNNIIGDPMVGVKKSLIIEIDGITHTIDEGSTFVHPKTLNEKLGVWYSNDTIKHPAIQASLLSIQTAAQGKADIVTCPWEPIQNNPFIETISWTKQTSHLNQLLQILQCLSTAQVINQYKYVSFLEHDVMYPIGYFDYPDFGEGILIGNMNYGGINKDGWQKRKQNDMPMHQMTMRFDDAFKHFFNILPNALRINSGLIEPQDLKRIEWNCINESIHINHGSHFTSHYTIYDSKKTYPNHPYWGESQQYNGLFSK